MYVLCSRQLTRLLLDMIRIVHCTHGGHVALEARRLVHDKRLSVVPVAARGTRLDLCRQLHWRLSVRVHFAGPNGTAPGWPPPRTLSGPAPALQQSLAQRAPEHAGR